MSRAALGLLVLALGVALGGLGLASFKGALEPVLAQVRSSAEGRQLVWGSVSLIASGAVFASLAQWMDRRSGPGPLAHVQGTTPRAVVASLRGVLAAAQPGDGVAVQLVDRLLVAASLARASDIHLTPEPHGLDVSMRLDGQVSQVGVLNKAVGSAVKNRIKILSNLRIEDRQGAQDGRLKRELEGVGLLEVRVSAIPTTLGERIVLRVLEDSEALPSLEELGFGPRLLGELKRLLAQPQGLLFVTGPVGSGKSTTLYACLGDIHRRAAGSLTLMTLEDPIERRLGFLAQSQVDRTVGHTFAQGLRSLLRQDPNVLMVGEIRDDETAAVALSAGQSGHLILTTIHAPGAVQVFPRLLQMGLSSSRLLDATLGVLSQRLVRRLCKACKVARSEPASEEAHTLRTLGLTLPPGSYFGACGCAACDYTGFEGRIPIAELLTVTGAMRESAREGQELGAIAGLTIAERTVPALLLSGLAIAAAGETPLSEVLKATGQHG